jgi:hypothetical protein
MLADENGRPAPKPQLPTVEPSRISDGTGDAIGVADAAGTGQTSLMVAGSEILRPD